MKIYKTSRRSASVPFSWFYSTLAVNRKNPDLATSNELDLDIRQARVTGTFRENLGLFFIFMLILMCNRLRCAGKRIFSRIFRIFLAGEEMHDKPHLSCRAAGIGADNKASRA